MSAAINAAQFVRKLKTYSSPEEVEKIQRYFKSGKGEYGEGDKFIGVRMGQLFELAKEFIEMPPSELEKLLESPIHEVRAGALSIMGNKLAAKRLRKRAEKSCSIFTLGATTGLTTGTWLILVHSI
jgi:hypothetical protein